MQQDLLPLHTTEGYIIMTGSTCGICFIRSDICNIEAIFMMISRKKQQTNL